MLRRSDSDGVTGSWGRYVRLCPVPGYKTGTCNNLRLWGSKAASGEFDFQKFNSGEYESSVADQQRAETISAVLYPNDK
jgi:starch phosphorylase